MGAPAYNHKSNILVLQKIRSMVLRVTLCVLTAFPRYKGLQKHTDVYIDEPGQLQCLVVVHPPPARARRLGFACAFYPPNAELAQDMALALITRWTRGRIK